MGRTIRELNADDFVLAEISHVTEDGVGIIGRSGKLHVPDCRSPGRAIVVRIESVEEGYVVGVPDTPSSDDGPLYVQRSSDTDDPDSDQLDELSYAEWRRRYFAVRLRERLPDVVADRIPVGSLSPSRLREATMTAVKVVAVLTVVALLGLAVTRGIVGLLNTYARHAL